MDSRNEIFRPAPAPLRALSMSAIWLHIGLIGATTVAAGLLELTEGAAVAWGLAMVLAGGALAMFGWRRGLANLQRLDPSATIVADAPVTARRIAERPPATGSGRAVAISAPLEQEP